jgi:hypothetical protein
VDSYGVWGILGTADAVANIPERIASTGTFGPLQRVAILGRNALPDQGFAIYGESRANDSAVTDAFGFIAGRSPFAGELTGVFGQGPQRGMIGIAGSANGIGVCGGSVGGAGTGVFGDAGDHQAGVIGRSNGSKGVGLQGENTGGGLAGLFQGNVRVDGGTLTVQGQFLSSEARALMGIHDFGEWKAYAVDRFRGILNLTVMNADKTRSAIPDWAKERIKEAWNVSEERAAL